MTKVVAPVAALVSVARSPSIRTATPAVSRTDTVPVADIRFGRPPQIQVGSSTIGFGATVNASVASALDGVVGEGPGPAHDRAAQAISVKRIVTVGLEAGMA